MLVLAACVVAPAQSRQGTFRATTRLVTVNVSVTDRQGNPIRDLKRGDFSILDGGVPQKISFYSAIDNRQPSAAPAPDADSADTYTNVLSARGAEPSVTILLFDTLNTKWESQGYALHRVRKFLRQVRPEDRLGIYVLGDSLKVVHDLTRDASDIVAAIQRYDEPHADHRSKTAPAHESTGDQELDRFLTGKENRYRFRLARSKAGIRAPAGAYRQSEIERASTSTVVALQEIARELAGVSGRKTLIWVTEDIGAGGALILNDVDEYLQHWRKQASLKPTTATSYREHRNIEEMIRMMNEASIAVYTVDARGLEAEDMSSILAVPTAPDDLVTDLVGRTPQVNPDMLELASRTGGRAFYNGNDLETAIRRAVDDARFSYTLAYYPNHNRWKGEWRKIRVTVNRPDVIVLARGGYFAMPDPRPLPPKNRIEFLSQVAASPIGATQLPLTVHLAVPPGSTPAAIDADVHLNPEQMLSSTGGGNWKAGFEVVFFQKNDKGKVLDVTTQTGDLNLTRSRYETMSREGLDMHAHLPFKTGSKFLQVVLHDKSSGAVGSLHIPLDRYSHP